MSFTLNELQAAASQALGGGAQGQVQTVGAFAAGLAKVRGTVDKNVARVLGGFGRFGFADALRQGADAAGAASASQESGLLASLHIPAPLAIAAAVVGVGAVVYLVMRRK